MYSTQKAKKTAFARENSFFRLWPSQGLTAAVRVSRVSESPGRDMLSAADFRKFIGVLREAVPRQASTQ